MAVGTTKKEDGPRAWIQNPRDCEIVQFGGLSARRLYEVLRQGIREKNSALLGHVNRAYVSPIPVDGMLRNGETTTAREVGTEVMDEHSRYSNL